MTRLYQFKLRLKPYQPMGTQKTELLFEAATDREALQSADEKIAAASERGFWSLYVQVEDGTWHDVMHTST